MLSAKRMTLLLVLLLAAVPGWGQSVSRNPPVDPVQWTLEWQPASAAPGSRVLGRLTAAIDDTWHLYSSTTAVKAIATRLELAANPAVASSKFFQPKPAVKFDPNFNQDSELYEKQAVFLVEVELAKDADGAAPLQVNVRYSACNDKLCLPPRKKTVSGDLTIAAQSTGEAAAIPADYTDVTTVAAMPSTTSSGAASANRPVDGAPVRTSGSRPGQGGLFQFAAVALGFGLLSIFTPCVFPMIPITMSYFISTQGDSPRASLSQALTFCLGVIVLFTGLGAGVSAALGPFGVVQLGSNMWVNLLIACVFIVFSASLLGAFEITMPSSVLTSLNRTAGRGDLLGTLVMGLVFALASFACTGPFVGTLLAGSISGDLTWPIFGMLMFSVGLALPFFFLAMFPAYLKRMPRSGGWLARTKITMGFLILAAAVKYLSNVDQMNQWWILTRERFLAIWIVLFSLAAFYLLGMLRVGDEEPDGKPLGLGRLASGALLLIVAVMLIPGMFGGRLGELDAFVPSPDYSGLPQRSGGGEASAQSGWLKNDYEGALALARQNNKRVLISFTGYACTNCHWMKANMFTRPEIAAVMNDLVVVELYTDGTDQASEKNQQLQLDRFGTVAIPFYAVVSPEDKVLAEHAGKESDSEVFRAFLTTGRDAVAAAQGREPASGS